MNTLIKRLCQFIIITLSFLLFLFLIDLYVFRGYVTIDLIWNINNSNGEDLSAPQHLVYSVEKTNNDEYQIYFQNRFIYPYYFWTYRNEEIFQEVTDTFLFVHASRRIINHPIYRYKTKYHHGVDCGSGLGATSLNPLESFEITIDKEKMLEIISWNLESIYQVKDCDKFIDVLKRDTLIAVGDGYVLNDRMKSINDSLEIQLYIPLFTYFKHDLFYASSNPFNIAYLDILEYEIDKRNKYDNWRMY